MLTHGERPHRQGRRIEKADVMTPLLVPSFSSCGFPSVAEIYDEMQDRLYGVCLISAADLESGCIPAAVLAEVNVKLVDSGMYEARRQASEHVDRGTSACEALWSRKRYLDIVADIDGETNVILVNYDGYEPLSMQISRALDDFSHAPLAAKDFLVKPEAPAHLVNVARLAQHADELRQFDVIGITAREAGDSLIQRCRTVVTLRETLDDANLNLPIHVFGAITPLEILAYFFCGADVFDGLNWLRLAFREQEPIPIETTAFDEAQFNLTDWGLQAVAWTSNLSVLYRLQGSLQRYVSNQSMDELTREFPPAVRAARVAELAGAAI